MALLDFDGFLASNRKSFTVTLLSLTWILGLFLGIYFNKSSCFLLVSDFLSQPSTIHGLMSVILFPLLLAYFLSNNNAHFVLVILFFCKAVSFGFTACTISHSFGSASWILQVLLQFSDVSCIALLFYMFFDNTGRAGVVGIVCGLLSATIDYFVISPFLQELL